MSYPVKINNYESITINPNDCLYYCSSSYYDTHAYLRSEDINAKHIFLIISVKGNQLELLPFSANRNTLPKIISLERLKSRENWWIRKLSVAEQKVLVKFS